MPEFKSKPTTVEAVLAKEAIRNSSKDWKALPAWLRTAYEEGGVVFTSEGVHLHTSEGTSIAKPRDWIVYDPSGPPYALTPERFAATFETA